MRLQGVRARMDAVRRGSLASCRCPDVYLSSTFSGWHAIMGSVRALSALWSAEMAQAGCRACDCLVGARRGRTEDARGTCRRFAMNPA